MEIGGNSLGGWSMCSLNVSCCYLIWGYLFCGVGWGVNFFVDFLSGLCIIEGYSG